jgi:hypothetical protein
MPRAVRYEIAARGVLGWAFLTMFLLWNALRLLASLGSLAAGRSVPKEPGMAAAQAIGASLGLGGILAVWIAGAAVLGLLAYVTRGTKRVVEETIE